MSAMNTMNNGRRAGLSGLIGWFGDRAERRRSRNALLGLDDAMLKDIGLTRAQAQREAGKSFW